MRTRNFLISNLTFSRKQFLSAVFCFSTLITVGQPNITADFISFTQSNIKLGDYLTFSFKVKNIGATTTNNSHTAIYLSPTTNFNDAVLLNEISTEALSANSETKKIDYVYPIPYSFNYGTYYLMILPDSRNEVIGNINTFAFYNTSPISISSIGGQQNLPYPVIFVHGLSSDYQTAWNDFISKTQTYFGWSYGGNLNFCLNQNGNLNNANSITDYKDWTNINSLGSADFYTINFSVGLSGEDLPKGNSIQSNQAAIVKQGLAIRDAIKHILQVTGRNKVILVGHSMGGLASREYLQNPSIWQLDGNHHVAKLLTLGTPHGGSNSTSFGVLFNIDELSEAVRDLRYSYYSGHVGVYLFGGNENTTDITGLSSDFYNVDVNCNGSIGNNIVGLNQKSIYNDINYSCIIGTGNILGGDGVVSAERANLKTYYPTLPVDTFIAIEPIIPPAFTWHTELPKQTSFIMQGIDESYDYTKGYEIGYDKNYFGNFTVQSLTAPYAIDYDDYKFSVSTTQIINFKLYNIPIANCRIDILDNSYNYVYSSLSNGKGFLDFSIPINAGNYYLEISALSDNIVWKNPYACKLTIPGNGACPSSNVVFHAGIVGTSYQWQVDNGGGYINVPNNSNYSGINSYSLTLNSPPTSIYGYKYRCIINGSIIGTETILKFSSRWNGTINSNWENPNNWNCGIVPDSNTDVIVDSNVSNFPKVNLNQSCRSLTVSPSAQILIKSGVNLNITGK